MNDEAKHDEIKKKFYIQHDGKESRLDYEIRGKDTIEFLHTFVPEELRTKGYASKIVIAGLNYARQNNLKVIPTCPFVKAFIQRNEEYKDLLK